MALSRYVITSAVTVPAGTPAAVTAGEPGTGGAAGFDSTGISTGYAAFPPSFQPGAPIILDPGPALYSYLNGAGALRAYVQGTDDVSHAAISNLGLIERPVRAGHAEGKATGPPARLAGL
jgi:hypothetical protein